MSDRKGQTPPPTPERRDRLLREHEHDTYKIRAKLPEPTACPECGALYRNGRWTWGKAPSDAHETLCPACHRIRDDYPAGFVTLSGAFPREHREEIVNLARNLEEREKAEHALKRIMAIRDETEDILITTTNPGLARTIGDALQHAYEGELDYQYTEEGNILRVRWKR